MLSNAIIGKELELINDDGTPLKGVVEAICDMHRRHHRSYELQFQMRVQNGLSSTIVKKEVWLFLDGTTRQLFQPGRYQNGLHILPEDILRAL